MTPQRWINNLLEVANDIADQRHQEERWLAPDAMAWEHPDELLCTVDAYVLDGFIEAFNPIFSESQRSAILQFRDEFESVCAATPQCLEASAVLADPGWAALRHHAFEFVRAFVWHWPAVGHRDTADALLKHWMEAYAEKAKHHAT